MSTTSSHPETPPGMIDILSGTLAVIRAAPYLLGLFLVSGILRYVLPPIIDSTVRIVILCIGVFFAYRGFGGQIRADSSFVLRLFMAVIATFISYLLLILSVFALAFLGNYNYVVFIVLALLGLYVYARLFLSAPAVMIDGYGPFEALSESWRLTGDAGRTIAGAVIFVFVGVFVLLLALLQFIDAVLIVNIGGIFLLDTLFVGIQAYLYQELSETPKPVVHDDVGTDARDVTG